MNRGIAHDCVSEVEEGLSPRARCGDGCLYTDSINVRLGQRERVADQLDPRLLRLPR